MTDVSGDPVYRKMGVDRVLETACGKRVLLEYKTDENAHCSYYRHNSI